MSKNSLSTKDLKEAALVVENKKTHEVLFLMQGTEQTGDTVVPYYFVLNKPFSKATRYKTKKAALKEWTVLGRLI